MAQSRRDVLKMAMSGLGVMATSGPLTQLARGDVQSSAARSSIGAGDVKADVVIIGAGMGGVAAALAALRNGLSVVLTEETDWIGGQLTSQAVPPDEHPHIESHGANQSYREFRERVRDYYRRNYPLTKQARENPKLNPGNGTVSRLCHEPRVALAVLYEMLAPWLSSGKLTLLLATVPENAEVSGDQVQSVSVRNLRSGDVTALQAPHFIDASELGDLLPLTQTEFVMGAESKAETGELHAAEKADPLNQQAFTMCFAAEYRPGEDHTIDRPAEYTFWRDFVPEMSPPWSGKLLDLTYSSPRDLTPKKLSFDPTLAPTPTLNLFRYRQLKHSAFYEPGHDATNITLVNWPQNDYVLGPLVGVTAEEKAKHIARATQLSLSLMYWLQTEVPRPDGGTGYPGLKLRGDLLGSDTGVAKYPYVRESRRIQALFTIKEEHVGRDNRAMVMGVPTKDAKAAEFADSVGIGYYHIDLHPSSAGNNYIDFQSLPFQIPLRSLIPKRVTNLLAANKNIGTTHITNGCYRLHPVEWGIGEAAGSLVAFQLRNRKTSHQIAGSEKLIAELQQDLRRQGIELRWPA